VSPIQASQVTSAMVNVILLYQYLTLHEAYCEHLLLICLYQLQKKECSRITCAHASSSIFYPLTLCALQNCFYDYDYVTRSKLRYCFSLHFILLWCDYSCLWLFAVYAISCSITSTAVELFLPSIQCHGVPSAAFSQNSVTEASILLLHSEHQLPYSCCLLYNHNKLL